MCLPILACSLAFDALVEKEKVKEKEKAKEKKKVNGKEKTGRKALVLARDGTKTEVELLKDPHLPNGREHHPLVKRRDPHATIT